jgi:glycosyltransferase involved in cell wall biosynthesis
VKIVVVASLAYSLVNFRGPLLKEMVACGHEVIACAPDDDRAVEAELSALGISFQIMPMARAGLNPIADLRTLAWLTRFFAEVRPELVLAYTQKPIIYAGIASRLCVRPRFFAMCSGLGHAFQQGGARWLRWLVALLYRSALKRVEAVFVFNGDDRGEMLRHHMIRDTTPVVQVPGTGVDLDHFCAAPPASGSMRFLMISRLLRSKGLAEYVEAARRVGKAYPDVRFSLLGPLDPNPAGIGIDQITAWDREGVVDYLGEVRDVRPSLAMSDVFVLPSWYREGLPRTILEAMAMGRPVITTDMPGCREPVEDGINGILVAPRDPGSLEAAMLRLVRARSLVASMGANARRTVVERFSVQRVNAILLNTMGLRTTTNVDSQVGRRSSADIAA